jgi:PII-like signaling protein
MRIEQGCLLRIFVGERDKQDGRPLYEWIVIQAHARKLSGATVYRGLMGFGAQTRVIHTFKIERLAEDLPVTIEIVDLRDKVEAFLTWIEQQINSGLIATVQPVEIHTSESRTKLS